MATQKSNIPALRFPEFKGKWEEKKLVNLCKMQAGKFIPAAEIYEIKTDNLYPCYGGNGLRGFTTTYTHNGKYPLIGRQGALCGNVNLANGLFYATEHAVATTPKENIEVNWIFYQLVRLNLNQYATGQAQPGLSVDVLEKVKSITPPDFNEQKKIADFLTVVDQKIAQLTEKKSCLEQYKKSVVQRLFTQSLRFPDTNGKPFPDWEERALGALLDYEQPTKYIVESTEYDDSYPIPVLTAGKTFILGYTNEGDGVFSKNLPVIIFDDFTTATQFVDFAFKAKSSAMKILKSKNKDVNIKLIYEFIQLLEFPIGEHKRYWISEFQYMSIPFPCPKEQQKIADFLIAIDVKITALGKKLTSAQDFKRALLQKMFV